MSSETLGVSKWLKVCVGIAKVLSLLAVIGFLGTTVISAQWLMNVTWVMALISLLIFAITRLVIVFQLRAIRLRKHQTLDLPGEIKREPRHTSTIPPFETLKIKIAFQKAIFILFQSTQPPQLKNQKTQFILYYPSKGRSPLKKKHISFNVRR